MSGRILIADTSSASRILLRARLAEAHYTVTVAATGAEVMAALRADRPDLLIADERLPDLDGVTLLRALRADPALARAARHPAHRTPARTRRASGRSKRALTNSS